MSKEAIELAKEIIQKKETRKTSYIPIDSEDSEFLKYKDQYVEIIVGVDTKSMHIKLYKPLVSANNPIIFVDDKGKCYRSHGARAYFIMYAERLLGKEITIGKYEHNVSKQEEIDKLIMKS